MKGVKRVQFFFIFLALFLVGCGQPKPFIPSGLSPSGAHQQFLQILKDENNLEVITREFEHSLWIYLPLENSYLDIEVSNDGPQSSDKGRAAWVLNYIDSRFDSRTGMFDVRYDISAGRKYAKDYGYQSNFTEEYKTKQRHIMTAITRIFLNVEEGAKIPEFFVIVMADVKKGLSSKTMIFITDLSRAVNPASAGGFQEEYARRTIQEYPIGDKRIIGDRTGRHVDFHDVTWEEFLARQMSYRIEFKYQRSNQTPQTNEPPREIITQEVQDTLNAYEWDEYGGVTLIDSATGQENVITKDEL